MIIAVASGKGGTGKTTISQAIAKAVKEDVVLLDCDVEEPNARFFLHTTDEKIETVHVLIPSVCSNRCTLCGKCSEVCEFNAIVVVGDNVIIFDELCHSCGGCALLCPEKAINEVKKPIGQITVAQDKNITLIEGKLKVGHPTSPPIIKAVKKKIKDNMLNIIDCPPGNACPVITAVNGADYVILVTEATPFGLNDLKISIDTIKEMNIPFGVIINRSDTGYFDVRDYLKEQNIRLLLEIPESMKAARAYSEGYSILSSIDGLKENIVNMIEEIRCEIV